MRVCDQWLRNDFLHRNGLPLLPECGCLDCPPFPPRPVLVERRDPEPVGEYREAVAA